MYEPQGYTLSQLIPFDQSKSGDWSYRAARSAVDVFMEYAICDVSSLDLAERREVVANIANRIRYAAKTEDLGTLLQSVINQPKGACP